MRPAQLPVMPGIFINSPMLAWLISTRASGDGTACAAAAPFSPRDSIAQTGCSEPQTIAIAKIADTTVPCTISFSAQTEESATAGVAQTVDG